MKLNVPPPPPPEPAPSLPASDSPAEAAPAAATKEPKPAAWPDWFGFADLALVLLVGLAAFLLGSFTARNSDAWLHLGIGRLVANGDYAFGKDPMSFTGAERYWVNHSWLYDLTTYQLIQASPPGTALVAFKACWFVLAMVLVVAIRRSGNALWPWAVLAALASLAAAPHLQLRPIVASTPFLAATLYLLFKAEWKPGSWRNPILLAVLFGVWANVDAWFILGPLTLLAVLLGELVQSRLIKGGDEGGVPLGVAPVAGLAKALGLGILACMLNPHHIHVWELPAEYGSGFPVEFANDTELRVLTQSPLTAQYWESPQSFMELNWHGVCFLVLLLGSGILLAFELGRMRVAHLFLWLAFAYLALRQSQLTMFFAVVAVPLAAAYLNGLSSGIRLTTWANRGTRLLLTGSGVGRLVCLPLALAMVVCAWPGWVQPPASQPAFTRRAEWRIEPDLGFERTASMIADWRASGALPADARGLTTSIHFGNFAAWFAPDEKVFLNGRFNFHKPELPDLYALRRAVAPTRDREETVDAAAVKELTDKYGATYLSLFPVLRRFEGTAYRLIADSSGDWSLWHIDGRASIVGRTGKLKPAVEEKLLYNPVRLAFGPNQTTLPERRPAPAVERTWLEEFRSGVKPPPAAADDATVHEFHARMQQQSGEELFRVKALHAAAALVGVPIQVAGATDQGIQFRFPPITRPASDLTDYERALAVLQVRAARQAVAANPDSPDGYFALYTAYQNPALPELWGDSPQFPGEKLAQRQAAAVQFLARIPPPEACNTEQAKRAFDLAAGLLSGYRRLRQLDFAQEAVKKLKAYYPMGRGMDVLEEIERARAYGEAAVKQAEAKRKAMAEAVDREEKQLTDALGETIGRFEQATAKATPPQKFQAALRAGLPGRAIEIFRTEGQSFGDSQPQAALGTLVLELMGGQLEQADKDFQDLSPMFDDLLKRLPPPQAEEFQSRLRDFEFRKFVLEGNYGRAGVEWERLNGNGRFPRMSDEDKAKLFVLLPTFQPESAAAAVMGGSAAIIFRTIAQEPAMPVFGALQTESLYHHVRGHLFASEGRMAEARAELARTASPQGETRFPIPWAPLDEQFVRMIDAAAKN